MSFANNADIVEAITSDATRSFETHAHLWCEGQGFLHLSTPFSQSSKLDIHTVRLLADLTMSMRQAAERLCSSLYE